MRKGQKIRFNFAGSELTGTYIGLGYLNEDTIFKVRTNDGFTYPIRQKNIIK